MSRTKVAVVGSGNIGTDLMIKVLRTAETSRWARWSVSTRPPTVWPGPRGGRTHHARGRRGADRSAQLRRHRHRLRRHQRQGARAQRRALAPLGKVLVDLTPAAIGPYVVPAVNLEQHLDAQNLNMVTCGGQATIPIVAAIAGSSRCLRRDRGLDRLQVGGSRYPRQHRRVHRDHGRRHQPVGGARRGKAIIILNPADHR